MKRLIAWAAFACAVVIPLARGTYKVVSVAGFPEDARAMTAFLVSVLGGFTLADYFIILIGIGALAYLFDWPRLISARIKKPQEPQNHLVISPKMLPGFPGFPGGPSGPHSLLILFPVPPPQGGGLGSWEKGCDGEFFSYRCDIVNHGKDTLINLAASFRLEFHEKVGGGVGKLTLRREWPFLVETLPPGEANKLEIFVSNCSDQVVKVMLPTVALGQRVGQKNHEQIPVSIAGQRAFVVFPRLQPEQIK